MKVSRNLNKAFHISAPKYASIAGEDCCVFCDVVFDNGRKTPLVFYTASEVEDLLFSWNTFEYSKLSFFKKLVWKPDSVRNLNEDHAAIQALFDAVRWSVKTVSETGENVEVPSIEGVMHGIMLSKLVSTRG